MTMTATNVKNPRQKTRRRLKTKNGKQDTNHEEGEGEGLHASPEEEENKEKSLNKKFVLEDHNPIEQIIYKVLLAAMYIYWIKTFYQMTEKIKEDRKYMMDNDYRLSSSLLTGKHLDIHNPLYLINCLLIRELWPFYLIYIVLSVFMQLCKFKWIRKVETFYSMICVSIWCGPILTICMVSSIVAYYYLARGWKDIKGQMYFAVILPFTMFPIILDAMHSWNSSLMFNQDIQYIRIRGVLTYFLLRILAFLCDMFDNYDSTDGEGYRLTDMFTYVFNITRFFNSPLQNYTTYLEQVNTPQIFTMQRCKELLWKILDQTFIFAFAEVLHHYIFVVNFANDYKIQQNLSSDEIFGLAMLSFYSFMLMQSTHYGTGHVLSAIDGIEISKRPDSILYVYNGLSLWRSFDKGTNLFLQKYILNYITSFSLNVYVGMLAKCVCFYAVCLAHGGDKRSLIWSSMGLADLMVGLFFNKIFMKIRFVAFFRDTYITIRWQRRIKCFLFVFSSFSCVYTAQFLLIGGLQAGVNMISSPFKSVFSFVKLVVISYLVIQVAIPLNNKVIYCSDDIEKKNN